MRRVVSVLFFVLAIAFFFFSCSAFANSARFESACKNRQIQVLSDVDDTIKASGTNFVAGIDTRWPGGSLYAGLGYFYLELSRGPTETRSPLSPGIVSARPKQIGGAFPDFESELLIAAKETDGIEEEWAKVKVVLPGEIDDNFHFHKTNRFREYARTKFEHVKEFALENPDKCIIFMGDNGQGDHQAGKQMLDEVSSVAAVFIHNVTSDPPLRVEEHPNIHVFGSYPEAASIAYKQGLVAKNSGRRVLEGSLKSGQYELCRACYAPEESQTAQQKVECLLSEVTPHFSSDGGGCYILFHTIERLAQEVSFPNLRLPKPLQQVVDHVIEDTTSGGCSIVGWVLNKIFWWSLIGALAVSFIALGAHLTSSRKPEAKKN